MSSSTVEQRVPDVLAGERLDRLVALLVDVSRAEASRLITEGCVVVDGVVAETRSNRVTEGSLVSVEAPTPVENVELAADGSVEIPVLFADDDVIVVDKPAGLVVHPGAGNADGTMVNGLLARFPDIRTVGEWERPGVVHRLDRGTSGLLVVARTDDAYHSLVGQLAERTVSRVYHTVVRGHVTSTHGVVDAAIGRSRRDPTRMVVAQDGRPARTHYEVDARFDEPVLASELTCRLETGRTHQIRVHLQAIGHPVLGDDRYGGRDGAIGLSRPWLHARELSFRHPTTGEIATFTAPLPDDLESMRQLLS